MSDLPVSQIMSALDNALATSGSAVLCAPPGSGKTTLVPLQLLQAAWLDGQTILLLEPRRLAARMAAARMAQLLGEAVGEQVGYSIRLERKVSPRTRVEVVTEGILTRRLQHDPQLQGIGLLIFDEFHERNLHSDVALALALDAQQGLREDLRLLVMSATLDTDRISALLNAAPVITAEGRQYPVTHHYLGLQLEKRRIAQQVSQAVTRIWHQEPGDILVFLPGVAEIRRVQALISSHFAESELPPLITPLYGDLPKAEQDLALLPDKHKRRRIVLTTSIAETSLTIEGVSAVVDSGWSRLPRFIPAIGMTRLETVTVSKAAANQRAGRAGRLGPGNCYRLWAPHYQDQLPEHHPAEILQADLTPLALELAAWGVADPKDLRWLDAPSHAAYNQACNLLQRLGAMDARRLLTPTGKSMARLPAHPRLAHILVNANQGDRRLACDLAALLSERDIVQRQRENQPGADLEQRLHLLSAWRNRARGGDVKGIDTNACKRVDRISRDWHRRMQHQDAGAYPSDLSMAQLLALAYPDRLGQRTGHGRFRLSNGRAALLHDTDPLAAQDFLVVAELDAGEIQGRVRLAAAITEAEIRQLPDMQIEATSSVVWDKREQRVKAFAEERVGAVVLDYRPLVDPDPELVVSAMLEGLSEMGLAVLPWSKQLRQWQLRVCWLGSQLDDSGWPDLSDEWLAAHLQDWLEPWLSGINSREQLQRLDLRGILQARLDWQQQQQLERDAPSHLKVPSGSRIPLRYTIQAAPILPVRLQEMFGLADTPRVCAGRVPVMLHLLSPAQRPMQITDDLAGFWERTYPEVKKELKGRYPKHYWPDDPMHAVATARAKPRKS
ncbi:ATP-dependent helicase HrpB [Candidatus Thiodiazotropha sp. CDECU1]|uniref:ATP-dependent helicase HrpB n=1 Tax=Candidatus Thiodiazotropha sp. CDECU1 TaxID=3065865 RepID=UPI002930865F|nr:ATP-dependent helicase HrpB [Candidatus Thiodiazotropha sp. CDECU1]